MKFALVVLTLAALSYTAFGLECYSCFGGSSCAEISESTKTKNCDDGYKCASSLITAYGRKAIQRGCYKFDEEGTELEKCQKVASRMKATVLKCKICDSDKCNDKKMSD